ncbi:MAG: ParB/RepB/Spo0J family partition protein [Candidatus Competibacterales bacterium]
MSPKRRGLGRGLDALLGAKASLQEDQRESGATEDEFRQLPIDQVCPGRFQPRREIRPEDLVELADSIRAQGVVQPIVVRPLAPARFEIIAGEPRWRARQMAGRAAIPAVVRRVPDQVALAMALIENIQRQDLDPLEEALALKRLIDEFDLTHQQAADAVGRSRAAVSNLLRLLELCPEVQEHLRQRRLEMGHARALLPLSFENQRKVAQSIQARGLSVRETEALVKQWQQGDGPTDQANPDPDVYRYQQDLSDRLGAAVKVSHSPSGRGHLTIQYNNLDELEGIMSHVKSGRGRLVIQYDNLDELEGIVARSSQAEEEN